jgi:hypothetical protein
LFGGSNGSLAHSRLVLAEEGKDMERRVWSTYLIIVAMALLFFVIPAFLPMRNIAAYRYRIKPELHVYPISDVFIEGFPISLLVPILMVLASSWIKSWIIARTRGDTARESAAWRWYHSLIEVAAAAVLLRFVEPYTLFYWKGVSGPVTLSLLWIGVLVLINGWVLKSTSVIGDRDSALHKRFFWIVGFSVMTPLILLAILAAFGLVKALLESLV